MPSVSFGMGAVVAVWLAQGAAEGVRRVWWRANGNLKARVWCRNEAKAAEKGLKAWQGAIRQFRNAIKRCCGGSLACPKSRGGFEKSLIAGKQQS